MVLERSAQPLAHWDILRLIDRGRVDKTNPATVSSILGSDRRFCWAGRGIYGLYRHGLLPGARDLNDVGLVFLYAANRPLNPDELCFSMRNTGYRFTDASLINAVTRYRAPLGVDGWGRWFIDRAQEDSHSYVAKLLELPPGELFDTVVSRAAGQVTEAITERMRRIEGDRLRREPAITDNSQPDAAHVQGPAPASPWVVGLERASGPAVPTMSWPDPPPCDYFEDPARVRRVHKRAVAIVEGRPVAPYVVHIGCRDEYLASCLDAYRRYVLECDPGALK